MVKPNIDGKNKIKTQAVVSKNSYTFLIQQQKLQ